MLDSVVEYMNVGGGRTIETHARRNRVCLVDSTRKMTLEKTLDEMGRVDMYRLIDIGSS